MTDSSNKVRRIRLILSDTFSFVRGMEANKGIAAVSMNQLIREQILRNGTTLDAASSQYDPYLIDFAKVSEASKLAVDPINPVSGSDMNQPTKCDRIRAIQTQLETTIEEVKRTDPAEFRPEPSTDEEDYAIASTEAVEKRATLR